MRPNRAKALWQEGKPVLTGWCHTPDPFTSEVMARAGFDALVLDMQHGMAIGPERAAVWLQIVGQVDTTPLVRIPWNEPAFAQWVLDAGAMGLIVPMVSTVEDAKRAAGACKYPPVGYRSNGPNRARFALGPDYGVKANDEIICLVMIETVEGVENVEEIVQVPGVDGVYIGPSDLARDMGLTPSLDVKDPDHVAACQKVLDVAKRHGKIAGLHPTGPEEALRRWAQGFTISPVCSDVNSLAASVGRAVAQFREGLTT